MGPGTLVADRFEVERLAGEGGMGAVYRARDAVSGELVALKVLRTQSAHDLRRFEQETTTLRALRNDGVVRYVASGSTADGNPFLAMEWLEGEDLEQRLARGPLAIRDAIELTHQIARTLAATHRAGVIHRDIKPSNIFLAQGDTLCAKLVDFGIARRADRVEPLTRTGTVLGTPGYMAPEQARGTRTLDARTDIFALGCVLFECMTGQPPFVGDTIIAVLAKILLEDPPRVGDLRTGVPPSLEQLVARMLAKDERDRPPSADAVLEALEAVDRDTLPDANSASARPPVLTGEEQRVACVVLVESRMTDAVLAATLDAASVSDDHDLIAAVEPYGARLEMLAGGAIAVLLTGGAHPADQAARAAKCALELRERVSQGRMVLATGRGVVGGRAPAGEVIDRAGRLLVHARPGGAVVLDEVSATLIGSRFELATEGSITTLRGEHTAPDPTMTVLGLATACIGRDRELAHFDALLDEAIDGPSPRAILLTAQPGAGKSRVVREFAMRVRAQRSGVTTIVAQGDPLRAGTAYAMARGVVRRAAEISDTESLAVQRSKLLARATGAVGTERARSVAEFLGELAGIAFPDDERGELRAARSDAQLMADRISMAWTAWIAGECFVNALLLILEDLHWCDAPSVRLVDTRLPDLGSAPLMVLATARPDVHDTFPKLWSGRDVSELKLPALARKHAEKIARSVLGPSAAADTIARLAERSDGNPFFLEELLRGQADGARIDALPDTVLGAVQSRLDALDLALRRTLRAASLFGMRFWHGGVAHLLGERAASGVTGSPRGSSTLPGETRASTERRLLVLLEREVIVRSPTSSFEGEAEYAFRHALVRDAAYAMLTDADRTLGHKLAGEWLEGAGESQPLVLAGHFDRGGAHDRAVQWYVRAAEHALTANDFDGARGAVARAIACGADGERLGALRLVEAEALWWSNAWVQCEQSAKEALALLPRRSRAWCRAVGELSMVASRLGHADVLASLAEELGSVPLDPRKEPHAVIANARVAGELSLIGARDASATLMVSLEGVDLGAVEEPAARALIYRTRGQAAYHDQDYGAVETLFSAAADEFDRIGDVRNGVLRRLIAALGALTIGESERAERHARVCVTAIDKLRIPMLAPFANAALRLALVRLGDLAAARAIPDAWSSAAFGQGPVSEMALPAWIEAIPSVSGEPEPLMRDAVERFGQDDGLRAFATAALARWLLASGNVDEAATLARDARTRYASQPRVDFTESTVRLAHAEALLAMGKSEEAQRELAAARDRLHARAARIGDDACRTSFLERVPDNARICQLARVHDPGGRASGPGVDTDGRGPAAPDPDSSERSR